MMMRLALGYGLSRGLQTEVLYVMIAKFVTLYQREICGPCCNLDGETFEPGRKSAIAAAAKIFECDQRTVERALAWVKARARRQRRRD
jgi:hypothetical protein